MRVARELGQHTAGAAVPNTSAPSPRKPPGSSGTLPVPPACSLSLWVSRAFPGVSYRQTVPCLPSICPASSSRVAAWRLVPGGPSLCRPLPATERCSRCGDARLGRAPADSCGVVIGVGSSRCGCWEGLHPCPRGRGPFSLGGERWTPKAASWAVIAAHSSRRCRAQATEGLWLFTDLPGARGHAGGSIPPAPGNPGAILTGAQGVFLRLCFAYLFCIFLRMSDAYGPFLSR